MPFRRKQRADCAGVDLGQGRPCCCLLIIGSCRVYGKRGMANEQLGHQARWPFFDRQKGVKMPRRPWTTGEVRRAHDMRAAGYSYGTIDKALGRFSGATQRRLEIAGHGSGRHGRSHRVPEGLLAERDALATARELRALTENFCGDPPPGYSALHGKTGQR